MRIRILAIVTIISALLVSQDLFAQEVMIQKRDRDRVKVHQKLNLTEEQQQKIDELRLGHQKEMIDLRANLAKKKLELSELKMKGNYTREQFLNKVNEINSAKNKIAIAQANHRMDVYQLLDDNQKKEWNKMSGKFGEVRKQKFIRKMRNIDVEIN
jgi:Spy/CpxP family protein refolding chaperone